MQRPQKSVNLVTHVMFQNYIHDVTLLIMQIYDDDDDPIHLSEGSTQPVVYTIHTCFGKYIGLLSIKGEESTPEPKYLWFLPEENLPCLKMIYMFRNMQKVNKTSWGLAGPSSAQAGIKLYFNFRQIWFLLIWIDRIGLIEYICFVFHISKILLGKFSS